MAAMTLGATSKPSPHHLFSIPWVPLSYFPCPPTSNDRRKERPAATNCGKMASTTLGNNAASTPPRSTAHRITPYHRSKHRCANQSYEHKVTQKDNKRRSHQPPVPSGTKKVQQQHQQQHQQQPSNKRQNVNQTPRKAKSNNSNCKQATTCAAPGPPAEPLLDASNPQDAHRIGQRQKMIAKGKNTVGYSQYRTIVPLEKRKAKSYVKHHLKPKRPNKQKDVQLNQ